MPTAAAFETTYQDLETVIDITTRGFCRRYKQDYEEARSEANLIFVREYHAYQLSDGKQPIDTWMRYSVWLRLLDNMRKNLAKCRNPGAGALMGGDTVEALPAASTSSDTVLGTLGDDAAFVAHLAIDTPAHMQAEIAARGGSGRNARSVIRANLYQRGWTPARVDAAFEEIKNSGAKAEAIPS